MNEHIHPTLVLGGGCFWCVEALYQRQPGVISVVPGYAGGHTRDPSYIEVCTGKTGHAEVVEITFNPSLTTVTKLLEFFWLAHDPTTLNRQGADSGSQYRSVILYSDDEQKEAATKSLAAAQNQFDTPIVTQIMPLNRFYPAEIDHHDYFNRNPRAFYCQIVIAPKIEKLCRE